jgi:hypothetical protein
MNGIFSFGLLFSSFFSLKIVDILDSDLESQMFGVLIFRSENL